MATSGAPLTSIPDEEVIKKASELKVLNETNQEVPFGSLFEEKKTIVVFIRHFFCGACQAYVTALSSFVPQETLDKAGVHIVLVGNGDAVAIANYKDITGFQGEVYTDPTRELYRVLGMTKKTLDTTPQGTTRKEYLTGSKLGIALGSTWRALKQPSLIGKQGSLDQLGGEFIFGPGPHCTFASLMQHTEDHVEVVDLMRAAGVVLEP